MSVKQKKAAREIAEIMYASLQQFPEDEQRERIKEIEQIPIKKRGKSSKRASTRASRPSRRRAATPR